MKSAPRLIWILLLSWMGGVDLAQAAEKIPEDRYYRIETISLPPDVILEVGGMALLPDNRLLVTTRHSEIWAWDRRNWKRWAFGLDEPLGIAVTASNQVVVAQRPELTRITDTDNDGEADLFETITSAWNYSGHIFEWAFGPLQDNQGNFWGTLTCWFFPDRARQTKPNPYSGWEIPPSAGYEPSPETAWRGWSFQVTSSGEFIPWSSGLRSPNGLGFNQEGELFVADNQGEYLGACQLHHITRGAFHGHPTSLFWAEERPANPFAIPLKELEKRRKPPAIIFPFGVMGQSASEPLCDGTGGKFGPFQGQLFIGDQTKATLMRVDLERVNGEFQGAAFPFRSGFQSGNNRLLFDGDGSLLVGQTDRGWGAVGGKPFGLQRVSWTGSMPFEIATMRAAFDGFHLKFTLPVHAASRTNSSGVEVHRYRYLYHRSYGSPEVEKSVLRIASFEFSEDGRSAELKAEKMAPGYIYELRLPELRAQNGESLLHDRAYYTLNHLPTRPKLNARHLSNRSLALRDLRDRHRVRASRECFD